MKHSGTLLIFIAFLEEFILWEPGRVTTITEILVRSIVAPSGTTAQPLISPTVVNPAWCALLFLVSFGPVARMIRSYMSYEVGVLLKRYGWILGAAVFAILLFQVYQALSRSDVSGSFLQIYETKPIWAIVFTGIALMAFVRSDVSGQREV